nr:aspartic peptidase [Tanacetum cinerariifolium]
MPKNVEMVSNVAPIEASCSSKNIGSIRRGTDVPSIDLVLQSKKVWRIFGIAFLSNVLFELYSTTGLSSDEYSKDGDLREEVELFEYVQLWFFREDMEEESLLRFWEEMKLEHLLPHKRLSLFNTMSATPL